MKINKGLIEKLEECENYELEVFTRIYTLDTVEEPKEIIQIGDLELYNIELCDKKLILEFTIGEKIMYLSDIDFIKKEESK